MLITTDFQNCNFEGDVSIYPSKITQNFGCTMDNQQSSEVLQTAVPRVLLYREYYL